MTATSVSSILFTLSLPRFSGLRERVFEYEYEYVKCSNDYLVLNSHLDSLLLRPPFWIFKPKSSKHNTAAHRYTHPQHQPEFPSVRLNPEPPPKKTRTSLLSSTIITLLTFFFKLACVVLCKRTREMDKIFVIWTLKRNESNK